MSRAATLKLLRGVLGAVQLVPGIAKWRTFAGGTSGAGRRAYQHNVPGGEFHLSPFTTQRGRFVGYSLQFAHTRAGGVEGTFPHGGLWWAVGVFRSPAAGSAGARTFYALHFPGVA